MLTNTALKAVTFLSININKVSWDPLDCFVSCTKLQCFIGAFMCDFSNNSNHTNSKLPITNINGPLRRFPRPHNEFTAWCNGIIHWTGIYKNHSLPYLLLLKLLPNIRKDITHSIGSIFGSGGCIYRENWSWDFQNTLIMIYEYMKSSLIWISNNMR